jgi:hypothetical protein
LEPSQGLLFDTRGGDPRCSDPRLFFKIFSSHHSRDTGSVSYTAIKGLVVASSSGLRYLLASLARHAAYIEEIRGGGRVLLPGVPHRRAVVRDQGLPKEIHRDQLRSSGGVSLEFWYRCPYVHHASIGIWGKLTPTPTVLVPHFEDPTTQRPLPLPDSSKAACCA